MPQDRPEQPRPTQPKTSRANKPATKPEQRSFAGQEPNDQPDPSEIDTFSRNDREGRPGPDLKPDEDAISAGEEAGYATDTFSRNDEEGLPGVETGGEGGGTSSVEAKPDAAGVRRVADDPDTRDARPPSADGGGVR